MSKRNELFDDLQTANSIYSKLSILFTGSRLGSKLKIPLPFANFDFATEVAELGNRLL